MDEDDKKDKIDNGEKLQEWIDNSNKFREETEAKITALEESGAEKDAEIARLKEEQASKQSLLSSKSTSGKMKRLKRVKTIDSEKYSMP